MEFVLHYSGEGIHDDRTENPARPVIVLGNGEFVLTLNHLDAIARLWLSGVVNLDITARFI